MIFGPYKWPKLNGVSLGLFHSYKWSDMGPYLYLVFRAHLYSDDAFADHDEEQEEYKPPVVNPSPKFETADAPWFAMMLKKKSIITLPTTNKYPLKIGLLPQKDMNHLNQPSVFRGKLAVSFRARASLPSKPEFISHHFSGESPITKCSADDRAIKRTLTKSDVQLMNHEKIDGSLTSICEISLKRICVTSGVGSKFSLYL